MSRKSSRNAYAPIGAAPNPLEIDHASGHKKSKRNQPRLDQSSNTYTERPTPKNSSPKHGGGQASCSTSSDDDADGDVSNLDAAEPDEESDDDGEGDAFALSGRAIKGDGDQAGRSKEDVGDRESTFEGKKSHGPTASKGKTKITKARPTLRDSDDDVYNRVDLISDSEEDEPNVEQLEERNIIESEEADGLNTEPAYLDASDGWEGFELEDGLFLEDVPYFDERYGRTDSNILDSEMELFQSASIFDGFPSPPPPSPSPRRVRFKEPISQLSNDSDMDSDRGDINVLFSPVVTPTVPSGGDLDLGGPYLDYEDDDGSSVGSSSGYETDYGDTTDEEDVPASATKRPQSLLRQPSLSSLELEAQVPATPAAKGPFTFPGTPAGYRRGPRMGTWIVDSTKPCAVIDSTANSIISTANASPIVSQPTLGTAPDGNGIDPSSFPSQASMYEYNDPVLGPGSDIVAASAPLPAGHSRQPSMDHSFAASSVFVPMDAMGNVSSFFEDDDLNDDDDDDDALLNIDDFIDFGDDSSEDGDQAAGDDSALTSPVTTEGPGPVQLKTPSPDATMASDDLMKHLDRHIVSAFRRGQPHHQPQPRPRHGNLSLNSYALKGGRQAAANAPMGPQKKRKMSGSFGHRPSFGVPAAKRRMIHHR
ncbi:hypothetical protein HO133_009644 [Letharia lupina]|uniref:Uncharacterized protein n=1 Tax=Letharia lupina TaxID=560253 RepID=A0A8H6CLE5_9LECA|nr:uncharacterized protein HO133_009644 [Letharia lupina]KAF6225644.1 hypothetical protein HO133_009644 [Letharia lupina]